MEFEDEEYNQFLQDLQQYPNYFQMGVENCSSNVWRRIAKKIEDEKVDLLEFCDLIRIKNQNLEACASYYLGDVDKAELIISKVLEDTNFSSINACAMMAILNYRKGEIIQAKRHLSLIKELAANPYNIDVAKSELAYAYTRLNPIFYKKAIALYTEAVERNPNNIPWKFGLAVIYRRCMNTSIQAMIPDLQIKTCFNESQKYLTYVLENCTDKKDNFFKASSYIELADLYNTANTTHLIYTDKRKIIDLVNQGVECLPMNTDVIMKAGRILRHCFKFAEAEELLQKAYSICPNSYICHQLGLIKKRKIILQHKKQRYFANKSYQVSGSWRDHSCPSTSAPKQKWATHQVNEPYRNEPINVSTTASDDPRKTMATGGTTILPNDSKTEKELAETLSKVSLTNTAEAGKEPVNLSESCTPPPVSSWQTSTIEKSGLQNSPVVKMTKLINSPKKETYDLELSRKLDPCLDLFRQSADLGQGRNLAVYYDWGITLLQMIPTKFDEVMEKFDHILANDRSPFMRYRCYEQYGICKLRMSESQDFDEKSRQVYQEDAKEMFRRATRCWAYGQKLNLCKHFDDAEGNCNSLKSIREIILGEDLGHGTKPKRDMPNLYYLMKQYGSSLSLYQEVYDKLQRTSDTAMDSEVIKGIIRNHLQLQQYTGVLDLLALLLCSKEGLQCLEFKTEVLTQMMHYSIETNDYQLWVSVFEFEKDPNGEVDNDVALIFNEEDQVSKKTGATLQKWLHAFTNSTLKVIKMTDTAENLPRLKEQIKLINNSKMAIFILANETQSAELTYLRHATKPKREMTSLYYLVKQYFRLYQEVYDELQCTSDTAMDNKGIILIIRNHLQQSTGLQYDVAIIFNEDDKDSKKKGATLQKWLHAFSNSTLKVIKSTETAANLPRYQEQIKLICHSKMAIFILANKTPSTVLTYLMNTAIEALLDNDYFLTKIFPIVINDGMVPDIFKIFRSMKITHQPNTLEEQNKSEFLKTFSDIFYKKDT